MTFHVYDQLPTLFFYAYLKDNFF